MKKYLLIITVLAGLSAILFGSCAYRTGEDDPNPPGCGNPDPVSYSSHVLSIIDAQCVACHTAGSNPGGGIAFNGYAGLKTIADNGKLAGTINHESGFKAMPRNQPQLADCTLELIQSWIDAGAPEN